MAELAVEVAAAEGGVVAVGEPITGFGQPVAHGAQDAGLADALLSDEDGDFDGLGDGGEQGLGGGLTRGGQPQVAVAERGGEGRRGEAEVGVDRSHQASSRWLGV